MILEGYFDESGTHDESATLSLAGFVSTPDRWRSFVADWQQAMSDFRIDAWHMKDFANRADVYEGWSEDLRRDRMSRLFGIIENHTLYSVGVVFSIDDYRAVVPPLLRRVFAGPYGMAAADLQFTLSDYARKREGWMVYVLEAGAKGVGQVRDWFRRNYRDQSEREYFRLHSMTIGDKRDHIGLQAADILAYELYRYLPNLLGREMRPPRWYHLEPLARVPHEWRYLTADKLQEHAELMARAVVRAASNPTIRPRHRSGRRKRKGQ